MYHLLLCTFGIPSLSWCGCAVLAGWSFCPVEVGETLPQQLSLPGRSHQTCLSGLGVQNHILGAETDPKCCLWPAHRCTGQTWWAKNTLTITPGLFFCPFFCPFFCSFCQRECNKWTPVTSKVDEMVAPPMNWIFQSRQSTQAAKSAVSQHAN